MTTKTFQFGLAQAITLALSGEKGIIIGRAEYDNSSDSYYIRYVDGTGCQVERWVSVDAIAGGAANDDDADSINPADIIAASTLPAAGGAELDSKGLPWDARIHSSNKKKTADGSWWGRKGVDKNLVAKIEGELRSTVSAAPAPAANTAPPLPLPTAAAALPMPPLPGVTAVPALPAVDPVFTNFVSFLAQHTKSDSNPNGRLTDEWVKSYLAQNGVAGGELQNLAHNIALIPPIEAALKQALGVQ